MQVRANGGTQSAAVDVLDADAAGPRGASSTFGALRRVGIRRAVIEASPPPIAGNRPGVDRAVATVGDRESVMATGHMTADQAVARALARAVPRAGAGREVL